MIDGSDGVRVLDRDGVLGRMGDLRQVLDDWIDDPAPKLAGLRVDVRQDELGLVIGMRVERDGIGHGMGRMISAGEFDFIRAGRPLLFGRALEECHLKLIQHLRNFKAGRMDPSEDVAV